MRKRNLVLARVLRIQARMKKCRLALKKTVNPKHRAMLLKQLESDQRILSSGSF